MRLSSFWHNRKVTLIALSGTVVIWLILRLLADADAKLLAQYHLSLPTIEIYYTALIVILTFLMILEPRLRPRLQQSRMRAIIVAAAGVISFLAVGLPLQPQQTRLFQFPFSLWLIIVHVVGLVALVVWGITANRAELPNRRLQQAALVLLIGAALLVLTAHMTSLGEFMRYDAPDEPWLASMATHYADDGDLSPSYIASAFGTPDPILPRYYWAMGLWLRLIGHDTLAQLRTFPLMVGGLAVVIFGLTIWRIPALTTLQKWAGLLLFLTFSPLVRTSHNLRMDIGLAVYGVLILVGLLMFFELGYRQKRWPILMGAALLIGLETVPTAALPLGGAVGLILCIWFLRQPERSRNWPYIAVYAAAGAVSVMLYLALHFLPDVQTSLNGFRQFSDLYFTQSRSLGLRSPFSDLINIHVRFSLSLSPIELIAILLAAVIVWRAGRAGNRWVLAPVILSIIAMLGFLAFSYSYWVMFTPFIAYIVA